MKVKKVDILGKEIFQIFVSKEDSQKSKIQEATSMYYQYTQFKKAYFNCTGVDYDNSTGRIIKLDFEFDCIGE